MSQRVVHIMHPSGMACCEATGARAISNDPRGKRCARCRSYLREHPQLLARICADVGCSPVEVVLGRSALDLEADALKSKKPATAARLRRAAEQQRELGRGEP